MMLLYKHWIDLRWQLAAILGLSLFFALIALEGSYNSLGMYEESGELTRPMQAYVALAESMGIERLFLWHGTVGQVFQLLLLAALILSPSLHPMGQADYYSMTLPVSRQRMLWTRFLLEWAGMGCAALVMVSGVALLSRIAMPWDKVWLGSVAAWTAVLPLLAAGKLVTTLCSPRMGLIVAGLALVPVLAISVRILHASRDIVQDPSLAGGFAAWAVLGTAAFAGLTALFLHEREY